MLWSEDNARLILDRLTERPSVSGAAAVIGGASRTIWLWCKQSADAKAAMDRGDTSATTRFMVKWPDPDGEPLHFVDAIQLARRMHAANLDADTREMLSRGTKRLVLRDNGMPAYEVDDKAIAEWGDDKDGAESLGGYFDYPYKHDEHGARIRLYVWDPVPAALKVHGLRAIIPGIYDLVDKRDVTTSVNGHVMVVGGPAEAKPTPLRRDLESRLAALRERGGPEHPRPEGRVQKFVSDDRALDPADVRSDGPAEPPALPPPEPKTLRDHPRAYIAEPITETVKRAPPAPSPYARPDRPADSSGVGYGAPHPGGMKTV